MKKIIVAIPAYNEADILEEKMTQLYDFFKKNVKEYNWKIIVGNDESGDNSPEVLEKLKKKYKNFSFISRNARSKSGAIRDIWMSEDADVYIHMDADLSTDIKDIPELINAMEQGYDIAAGSRTSEKSQTSRTFNRHIISMGLILLLRLVFGLKLSDFQCGFKAINKKTRENIIPKMRHISKGFMDTEMLIVAHKKGYKIKEIPIIWKDERKSKFNTFSSMYHFFKNIAKVKLSLWKGDYN